MKKPTALFTLLLLPLLLPSAGCWDRREMNDLALVLASGYDLGEDGAFKVTLQISKPSGGKGKAGEGSGEAEFLVQSMTGHTVHDAFVKIQERMSRQLYEGHRRVIVIGESLAKHGVKNLLDQFSRDPKSRFRSYILVARQTEAGQLLSQKYPFEHVPAEAIRELEKSRVGFETTLRDYLTASVNEGVEPVMGVLEPISSQPDDGDKAVPMFHLAGIAVFKDYKLIGYLDDRESRSMLWLKGERSSGIYTAYVPPAKGYVSVEMRQQDSKIEPVVESDGSIAFHIRIHAEAVIHENNTALDIGDPANLQTIQDSMRDTLKKRIVSVIERSQHDFHQDIFGFGQEIHRHHKPQWMKVRADWEAQFEKTRFDVDVDLHLVQMGMTRAPLQLPTGEVKHQ